MNRRRGLAVVVGLALAVAVVVGRSVQVMVLQHGFWASQARRQQEQVIEAPGPRGQILSADGYVLATSVERYAIQLDTRTVDDPGQFAEDAAKLLNCPAWDIRRRFKGGARSVWVAQRVERRTAEKVQGLAPHAVVLVPDSQRVYPLGTVAAPVVGFVGREELATIGRAGLEHYYDALLSGEPQTFLAIHDAVQRRLSLRKLEEGRAGYDLELTINARLQASCELELAEVLEARQAKAVSAVVLDARTGSVLAIVSLPSFDPSSPASAPQADWRLRPVQDAYEPGSVVKPLVAAAALAQGAVRPGELFDCRQRGVRVAGKWLRDHAAPGIYTLDEIVSESANAGIVQIALRMRRDDLWRTFDAFGFGRRTGVGFPGESAGILPPVRSWSGLSQASLALGQELTVTPLQVALAYAAIANGGWLLQPRLVARATGGEQSVPDREQWRAHVLDAGLSERVGRMLEAVVEDGTGKQAQVPGYRVAGKTGTAQRAVHGTFDDVHHVAWFAGFLPQPDPSVVVVVAVEEPGGEFWGATVAAPVFARVARAAMCQLVVAPTEEIEPAAGEAT
ncbi:MAG TPA: penicillin-binding protein 2 [Thermoanaerobaculales bacterium]|nr:penicillin-binding protein 2 [Thermoanaerobaculales bacterium]HPA80401.1 penicillin-binding protein 2 [Thermoanaerobaculales bacterium]HQL30046.1 penicillin-binding protein 2 [Thermoanaerobaculales bacterium]HQN96822.1 penicillin-binding protein 2 [Thermoanaerobaculales bacterium]HQP43807.1 penicillin-binding protein 2 [Thermoanaerobaculales bacterium]